MSNLPNRSRYGRYRVSKLAEFSTHDLLVKLLRREYPGSYLWGYQLELGLDLYLDQLQFRIEQSLRSTKWPELLAAHALAPVYIYRVGNGGSSCKSHYK